MIQFNRNTPRDPGCFFFFESVFLNHRRPGVPPAPAIDDGYNNQSGYGSTTHAMPDMILNTKNSP